jgi:hypothetical protein
MLLERVTKDLKRSPGASANREVPRPSPASPSSSPSPFSQPQAAAPPPSAPAMQQPAPSSPAAPQPSPFTTTRGEFGTQHPAAERAERTAASPPPARAMQRENPPSAPDNGFFQRETMRETPRESQPQAQPHRDIAIPGDNRLVKPASADVSVSARAAQSGEPLVIPVRLDGTVREIVLRIVIEQPEQADQRR